MTVNWVCTDEVAGAPANEPLPLVHTAVVMVVGSPAPTGVKVNVAVLFATEGVVNGPTVTAAVLLAGITTSLDSSCGVPAAPVAVLTAKLALNRRSVVNAAAGVRVKSVLLQAVVGTITANQDRLSVWKLTFRLPVAASIAVTEPTIGVPLRRFLRTHDPVASL